MQYFSLLFRLDQLGMGCMLSWIRHHHPVTFDRVFSVYLVPPATIALLYTANVGYNHVYIKCLVLYSCYGILSCFIVAGMSRIEKLNNPLTLALSPILVVGYYSYQFYLVHLLTMDIVGGNNAILYLLLANMAIAYGIAVASELLLQIWRHICRPSQGTITEV